MRAFGHARALAATPPRPVARRVRRLAAFGALVAVAAVAAGCSGPASEPTAVPESSSQVAQPQAPPDGSSIRQWLDYLVGDMAASESMSEQQRTVLEAAAEEGELTHAAMTELIGNAIACIEDAGMRAYMEDPEDRDGLMVPTYTFSESEALGPENSRRIADECIDYHSGVAELIYLWQPTSMERINESWNIHKRPLAVECLAKHGIAVDDDMTRSELEMMVFELFQDPRDADEVCNAVFEM